MTVWKILFLQINLISVYQQKWVDILTLVLRWLLAAVEGLTASQGL